MVGGHVARTPVPIEAERDAAIGVGSHGHELTTVPDRPGRQLLDHPGDQLVVAAHHMEALVVAGQRHHGSSVVVADDFDQVQRRLVGGVAAILGDRVGLHQLAESAVGADRRAVKPLREPTSRPGALHPLPSVFP